MHGVNPKESGNVPESLAGPLELISFKEKSNVTTSSGHNRSANSGVLSPLYPTTLSKVPVLTFDQATHGGLQIQVRAPHACLHSH